MYRFLIFFCGAAFAQNLVGNPSFEQSDRCAKGIGLLSLLVHDWNSPTSATPDFFNRCYDGQNGVPTNYFGEQMPHDGENYAGFYLYTPKNYREYIQVKLNSPLEKDSLYRVSFWVSLAERSDKALSDMGITFTQNKVRTFTERPLTTSRLEQAKAGNFAHFVIRPDRILDDKNNWMELRMDFTAQGWENYLIIGNFKNNWSTKLTQVAAPNLEISYYFIDKVSLTKITAEENISVTASVKDTDEAWELNRTYIMENITFEFDSDQLTDSGQLELKNFWEQIKDRNHLIHLTGHTDNIGRREYNQDLSQRRVLAIADCLAFLGYDPKLIWVSGCADEMPIHSNDSEESRARNRRVEFQLEER